MGAVEIRTQAVRTREGYRGQVLVGDVIVWEDDMSYGYENQAQSDADSFVADALGKLLRQSRAEDSAAEITE